MVEAEASIVRLFAKRGFSGGYSKAKLVALAVARRRLSVLIPPRACSDGKYGCVVRIRDMHLCLVEIQESAPSQCALFCTLSVMNAAMFCL